MTLRADQGTHAGVPVSKIVAVRLPDETVARVEAHRKRLRQLTGLQPSLSEVIKLLVERGLEVVEGATTPKKR